MKGIWGIYDNDSGTWLGDDKGVIRHDDETMARLAAQVMSKMIDCNCTHGKLPDDLRYKDEVPILKDALTVIKELESGQI